jgi:hypothetical protein
MRGELRRNSPLAEFLFAARSIVLSGGSADRAVLAAGTSGSDRPLRNRADSRPMWPKPTRHSIAFTGRIGIHHEGDRQQMGDWRRHFRAPFGGWVHPDSPAGGIGPGFSRVPGHHPHWESSDVPHLDSPAGQTFDWSSLARIDIDDRVRAVVDAIRVAQRYAPAAILEATGVEFGAILDGLLPGLLMCLCVVAATTALGAAAGAAIGAFGLGLGAAPGAAFGATAGFEAGVALLEGLGLAFLVSAIGTSVVDAGRLARRAVYDAWHSVDEPNWRWSRIDHAGRDLALAAAALMRGVLQGIVAFLVAKGANAAASRVPELAAKLRASKLGEGFAAWVERNWASLIKNERLKQKPDPKAAGGGKGSGGTQKTERAPGERATNKQPRASNSTSGNTYQADSPPSAAKPKPKNESLSANQKARAQRIGKTAVQNSGGSVRRGVAEVNAQDLSQAEAVEALRAMYEPGRKIGEVVPDGNGNLVVLSRNTGRNQPVNIIDQDGKISFGRARIEEIDLESVKARVAAEPDPQKKLDILNEPRKFSNVEKDEP